MMRSTWSWLGALALCLVVPVATSVALQAQVPIGTQATEAQLKAQIEAQPGEPAPYLSLAVLMIQQGRFDEAQQMITNALALTRRMAAAQRPAVTPSGPGAPIRVGGDIAEPKKIKDVKPEYPPEARAAGISGLVIVEALIGRDGKVMSTNVLRSVAGLDDAAVDAVSQWEYVPTLLNGVPVEVIMTVTVNFSTGG